MHIALIIVVASLAYAIVLGFGVFVGARLRNDEYHGAIRITETPEGLIYMIEVAGDPELLVFQDSVTLKVIPPDYEKLLSRGKLGV